MSTIFLQPDIFHWLTSTWTIGPIEQYKLDKCHRPFFILWDLHFFQLVNSNLALVVDRDDLPPSDYYCWCHISLSLTFSFLAPSFLFLLRIPRIPELILFWDSQPYLFLGSLAFPNTGHMPLCGNTMCLSTCHFVTCMGQPIAMNAYHVMPHCRS